MRTRTIRQASACAAIAVMFVLMAPAGARAVDANAVDGCHQAILHGLAAMAHGRLAHLARCLKEGNYDDSCVVTDLHEAVHDNEMRNHVGGASSDCQAAVDSGASVSDFGPTACSNEWADCDTEIPSVTTLPDVAECLVCNERGYDLFMRSVLGMPRSTPSDPDERRCTKLIATLVATTVHKAIVDAEACAEGGTKPFACPVDPTTDSKFGSALDTFAGRIARCGIDNGKAPGVLTNLCGGTATDSASLGACFRNVAKCIACRTMNQALEQTSDCTTFSGYAECDGMF